MKSKLKRREGNGSSQERGPLCLVSIKIRSFLPPRSCLGSLSLQRCAVAPERGGTRSEVGSGLMFLRISHGTSHCPSIATALGASNAAAATLGPGCELSRVRGYSPSTLYQFVRRDAAAGNKYTSRGNTRSVCLMHQIKTDGAVALIFPAILAIDLQMIPGGH